MSRLFERISTCILEGDAEKAPKLIQKDWQTLFQTRLNVAWLPPEQVFLRALQRVFTGETGALERAVKWWNFLRVFTLLGFNLMLWGHVVVAAWQLFR